MKLLIVGRTFHGAPAILGTCANRVLEFPRFVPPLPGPLIAMLPNQMEARRDTRRFHV